MTIFSSLSQVLKDLEKFSQHSQCTCSHHSGMKLALFPEAGEANFDDCVECNIHGDEVQLYDEYNRTIDIDNCASGLPESISPICYK